MSMCGEDGGWMCSGVVINSVIIVVSLGGTCCALCALCSKWTPAATVRTFSKSRG